MISASKKAAEADNCNINSIMLYKYAKLLNHYHSTYTNGDTLYVTAVQAG